MASKKSSKKRKTTGKRRPAKKINNQSGGLFANPIFVHGLIWSAVFALTSLFMYINTDAVLAQAARRSMGGLFGIMSYTIPIIFGGTLIYLVYFKSVKKLWGKFVMLAAELCDMSAIIGIFASYGSGSAYRICSEKMNGGGVIGVGIAEFLKKYIGSVASFVVLVIMFVTLACFITRTNILPYLEKQIRNLVGFSGEVGDKVKTKHEEYISAKREEKKHESEKKENLNIQSEKFEIPEQDELPESLTNRIKKHRRNPATEVVNEFAADVGAGRVSTKSDLFDENLFKNEDLYSLDFSDTAEADTDKDIADDKPVKEKKLTETEKKEISGELENAMQNEVAEYKFPTLDLLDAAKKTSQNKRQELYSKAEHLISVLDNFGVRAKLVQVTQGPTVTRYEIQPESGVKLSKIVGLADDIALNLAVSTVLIAPVPGKAATVGVEIPNSNVTPVTIREMLDSAEFKNAKSKLTVCLGKDIGGNVIVGDIAKWPHALIAGATGSGKSVCINTIVTSILYKASPNDVKLIMIDPKQVELGVYNGIPHLLIPVVTEAKKAAGALNWAVSEMMQRYEMFKNSGVRKLEMYNKLMEKTGGEKLPQLVIIIDELADLMMVAAKEVEDYVCRLAQLARAAGIHLIIATQRPSVDVITGLIKANIPSRIAFFVSSQVDSRTILDKAGAEKLLGMGDMLYFPTGARSTTRVQGAFVSDGEVERIIEHIKETSPVTHYSEDLEEHIERISLGENGVTPDKEDDGDELLNDAIKLAVELGKISTSMIQRRLSVGYSRAGRIIDQMEARGIVSPPNGSKPRDVLISHADMVFDETPEDVEEDE